MTTVRFSGSSPLLAAMQLSRAAKPQAGQSTPLFPQTQSHPTDSFSFTATSANNASHNDVLFGMQKSKAKTLRMSDLRRLQNWVHRGDGAQIYAQDLNPSGSRANYFIRTEAGLRPINREDMVDRAAFEQELRRAQQQASEAEPSVPTEPPPAAPIQITPLDGWVTRGGGFETFVNKGRSSRDDRFYVRDDQEQSGYRQIDRRELDTREEWEARQALKGKSVPVRSRPESVAPSAAESSAQVSRRDLDSRRQYTTKLGEDVFKHKRTDEYYARNEDDDYVKITRGDLLKREPETKSGIIHEGTGMGRSAMKGGAEGLVKGLVTEGFQAAEKRTIPKHSSYQHYTAEYQDVGDGELPPDPRMHYHGQDMTFDTTNPNAALVDFKSSAEVSLNSEDQRQFEIPEAIRSPGGKKADKVRLHTQTTYLDKGHIDDADLARRNAPDDGEGSDLETTRWKTKKVSVKSTSEGRDYTHVLKKAKRAIRGNDEKNVASRASRPAIVDAPAEGSGVAPAAPAVGPDIHDRPQERREERDRDPGSRQSRNSRRSHQPSRRSGTRPARESRRSSAPQGERHTNEDYPEWSENMHMAYRWRMHRGRRTDIREYENGTTQNMNTRDNLKWFRVFRQNLHL